MHTDIKLRSAAELERPVLHQRKNKPKILWRKCFKGKKKNVCFPLARQETWPDVAKRKARIAQFYDTFMKSLQCLSRSLSSHWYRHMWIQILHGNWMAVFLQTGPCSCQAYISTQSHFHAIQLFPQQVTSAANNCFVLK